MEAGVPFALLSSVQLLALAAAGGLAAAGFGAVRRMWSRVPVLVGGVLLAATHLVTAAQLGSGPNDVLAILRAAGYVLVAIGIGGVTAPGMVVIAPIGAALSPSTAAAAAALIAALASFRVRSGRRMLLVGSLIFSALAELLGPAARTSDAAAAGLLVLRGIAAALLLGWLAELARRSLLAKVVAIILASVLALAIGAAAVVGSVATVTLGRDQARRVKTAAQGQLDAFEDTAQNVLGSARVLSACRDNPEGCAQVLRELNSEPLIVVAVIRPNGQVDTRVGLDQVAVLSLAQSPAVQEVFAEGAAVRTLTAIQGSKTQMAAVGIAPIFASGRQRPGEKPSAVAVYGAVIGQDRVNTASRQVGFDLSVFIAHRLVVSSAPDDQVAGIAAELTDRDVERLLAAGEPGITVVASGSQPTVHYAPIKDSAGTVIGTLALSAPSRVVLETQRRVLQTLFLVTVLVALLVGVVAVLLGRRIVQPIRDLTEAASRVRRGDLGTSAPSVTADEVGTLSRAFDAMTRSLSRTTSDLRQSAVEEATLRERLETVLASMADALLTTDAIGLVTSVNASAERLLGLEQTELIGRPLAEVVSGADLTGGRLVRDGDRRAGAVGTLISADGTRVPVALARRPLQGGGGDVVVLRDTTRESQVERMKTEFLANVSHELRTPLTPIRGYADILRRKPDLPREKALQYASDIHESSLRMSRVVDLLVDVAAIEGGRVVPEPRPVAIGPFIDERLRAWRSRVPGRTFRRRVAAGLPRVLVDPIWVGKALDELVDNAVKYSGPDAPITLTAGPADDPSYVRITVRDAGRGIEPDAIARLFTPFEQVDGSATREVGGLGLGLSFVRRLAQDFGLHLHVESTPGTGSAFSLDLPVAPKR